MMVMKFIIFGRRTDGLVFTLGDIGEPFRHLFDRGKIKIDVVSSPTTVLNEQLGRRM